jgi:CRISPR-associated protein Cas7/Cse4/CasC, subtype I-E/ECOLI
MSTFIQLHLLTCYPPSNLNRDDLGRPKTAIVGGVERLRVSSQSLKRAWRTSDVFQSALAGNVGVRTKEMGVMVHKALTEGRSLDDVLRDQKTGEGKLPKLSDAKARAVAKAVAGVFGALKKPDAAKPHVEMEIEQLAHFSPEEIAAVSELVEKRRADGKTPEAQELALLRAKASAADIALFGRMLADAPEYNIEAAAQVGHAFGVERATVQDDFFTAVDDLNRPGEDAGAGHMGVMEFGSALFYLYICVNRDLLRENLGDKALADRALRALVQAAATVAPTGKQNSFASRSAASFVLAEKGEDQPRSLVAAFLQPVSGPDMLANAREILSRTKANMDTAYGLSLQALAFNPHDGEGTLAGLLDFVAE